MVTRVRTGQYSLKIRGDKDMDMTGARRVARVLRQIALDLEHGNTIIDYEFETNYV